MKYPDMTQAERLEWGQKEAEGNGMNSRIGYVGGSNVAGILGLSPFRTPLDEYYTITGEMENGISAKKQEWFEERREWEPVAFKRFERKTGMKILATNVRYPDPVHPWMQAEIDFEPAEDANGEVKTCDPSSLWMWGDPELDEPPMYVMAQVMWGLGVTEHLGKTHAFVQRFSLNDNAIYRVEADDSLIRDIRDRVSFFWTHHIEKKRPPQPTNVSDVLKLYGRGTERAVEATDAIGQELIVRKISCDNIKTHEANKLAAELEIKKFMRDASVLTVRGHVVATWKANKNGVRTFRMK